MLECVLQVLLWDPDPRILVCAPSNAAADLLALRLVRADAKLRLVRFGGQLASLREQRAAAGISRFETRQLVFGLPQEAALGVEHYMCVPVDRVREGLNLGVAALAEEGLEPEDLRSPGGLRPRGARRPLVVALSDLEVDAFEDGAVWIRFSLPVGSFATVVLAAIG